MELTTASQASQKELDKSKKRETDSKQVCDVSLACHAVSTDIVLAFCHRLSQLWRHCERRSKRSGRWIVQPWRRSCSNRSCSVQSCSSRQTHALFLLLETQHAFLLSAEPRLMVALVVGGFSSCDCTLDGGRPKRQLRKPRLRTQLARGIQSEKLWSNGCCSLTSHCYTVLELHL